jgi:drug/metabolite transporter (DMT)-like permease
VSLCRFLYGLPIITLIYFVTSHFYGKVEIVSSEFFLWIFLFSICQITANTLWVLLFNHKNFAVSISYIKIETIFVAIFGGLFLAEKISIVGWAGIITAFLGLFLTTLAKEKIRIKNLQQSLFQKSPYIGLSAGIIFAVATIAAKKSFLFLESDFVILQ